jgi:putative ABC transport system ATP-binding protein
MELYNRTVDEGKYAVIVKSARKRYKSADTTITRAINNVSLKILFGEFLMITGRNGSGKSTLMHLMALLDTLSSGDIIIYDKSVSDISEKDKIYLRLKSLGYIFQEYALIQELTALENVMLPSLMINSFSKARKQATKLLKKVDLDDKMNHLPSELSGGEQQRVAIARALVNNPRIIFADEPTANLDSVASKHVLEIFKKLNENDHITIVMVTHEPEELIYASRIINLKDGKIYEK